MIKGDIISYDGVMNRTQGLPKGHLPLMVDAIDELEALTVEDTM